MASLLKGSAKGKGTKIKVEVEDFITTAETFALTSPDRAGFLVKQGQKNTSSKKSRYFVLDGNLLVYYERENDPSSAVLHIVSSQHHCQILTFLRCSRRRV
mmetsp:Transcript_71882/g.203634  ORF Transcript_71882/g.203634 Transcript_71882/m.203634 type:complete len:101 (-) Transcript_71882:633-935(-)